MTWWAGMSLYVRNSDDLRLLSELFRIHLGSIIGRQIYPIVEDNPSRVRSPYTIDHNRRPAIVAIYISLLDPDVSPKEYPASKTLANAISERKVPCDDLKDASSSLVFMLNVLTRAWFCHNKHNSSVRLDAKTRLNIQLFAETLTLAAQIYQETLERNRAKWDKSDHAYICDSSARDFNFAFDMHYINLAIDDLSKGAAASSHTMSKKYTHTTIAEQGDATYDDLPALVYDNPV